MMYDTQPSSRYQGLTKEQVFIVDQFVMKLLAGEAETPAEFYQLKKENEELKAQLEALNSRGFDLIKSQIEYFFKEKGFGDTSKQLEHVMRSNDELQRMVRDLLSKGLSVAQPGAGSSA